MSFIDDDCLFVRLVVLVLDMLYRWVKGKKFDDEEDLIA